MFFKDAAQRFIETHRGDWKSAKHVSQWENTLKDYAHKAIGDRPISAIDGALITDTLAPISTKKPKQPAELSSASSVWCSGSRTACRCRRRAK